jgi:Guanylate-binding protein, C-terminal domain
LRPEFHVGLDELTKFVLERTRPKQVGSTVMTGPVLAGITQSFLDAINNGAVPIISSSWQVDACLLLLTNYYYYFLEVVLFSAGLLIIHLYCIRALKNQNVGELMIQQLRSTCHHLTVINLLKRLTLCFILVYLNYSHRYDSC